MKIRISYYYQIRNFEKNIIPLSTAIWPPFWYGNNEHTFIDQRGIINGYEADCFKPEVHGEVECGDKCKQSPDECRFLREYYEQLCRLSFKDTMRRFEEFAEFITKEYGVEDPVVCLMVYEPPKNPCSERRPLQKWFKENGYELKEWEKGEIE